MGRTTACRRSRPCGITWSRRAGWTGTDSGCSPTRSWVGQPSLLDAAHPEDRRALAEALQRTGQEGADTEVIYRIRRADGMLRWVRTRGFAVRDGDGRVYRVVGFVEDITERNLEAQALRNARLASIGVLAAGVAHEINNPNNAIQFSASLFTRAWRDVTPILREYVEENGDFALAGLPFSQASSTLPRLLTEITSNSERIRRIVENLKHMSRQDTGELTEKVDIQQVLEAAVMILHNQIQKFTDACTLQVPDGLPPVVGNCQQLEQVFVNVLFNALQALPNRTRGVHISAGFDADDRVLWIAVRDEGCGITERDLGRLTEPFFTTRTDAGGTGLGLSISRAIVERHGGSMGFESQLGSGTTVTIRIPTIQHAGASRQ